MLLSTLNEQCQTSINGACSGWAESKAAYRFFDNPQADPQQILAAHRDATLQRMQELPTVCIAQDTTELDYSSHPTADALCLNALCLNALCLNALCLNALCLNALCLNALCLNTENRHGLYDHSSIAFTPDKMCLGVLDAKFFDREAESLGTAPSRKSEPIESKESYRWLEGYRLCCEMAAQCPDTQIVSVADREGDIFEVFAEAAEHPTPAEFVIRSHEPRRTTARDPAQGPRVYRTSTKRSPSQTSVANARSSCQPPRSEPLVKLTWRSVRYG